ncbi:MAG: isoprenyl transferase [Deltaproteobacteria bacterium HGW-Deltaproteobacteria-19]|nr:MAG: isoprenyl transferase [Deltaproteobacteria bacterium HGW-Deltaproteobacteria-19]
MSDFNEIDSKNLPGHIAVIMDGNGRWAKKHAMGRIAGHRKGAEAVRTTVRTCRELGIKCLTLYAFSVENWLRPAREVSALMDLLVDYLQSESRELQEQGIRLQTIGNTGALREPVQRFLRETMEATKENREMVLILALSYGGRDEILQAARALAGKCSAGLLAPGDISKDLFEEHLQTAGIRDPDLLVRTSGEFRISNFLLWQMAYTEFYFTDVLWPDFDRNELLKAIAAYQQRERRFGLTSEQL